MFTHYIEILQVKCITVFILQCTKLKELISEVRDKLSKKDDIEPEEIRKSTTQLQQASLKLFEMAYKKVGN